MGTSARNLGSRRTGAAGRVVCPMVCSRMVPAMVQRLEASWERNFEVGSANLGRFCENVVYIFVLLVKVSVDSAAYLRKILNKMKTLFLILNKMRICINKF